MSGLEPIQVLGICTSPRKGRNTQTLLARVLDGCREAGAETELFTAAGKDIKPCIGCWSCKKTGRCVLNDDMQELYEQIKRADVLIFGTPVFFYDVNSQCKLIIDRLFSLQPLNGNKTGAIAVTAGSMGTSGAIKTLEMIFGVHGIVNAGWVSSYGRTEENEEALASAFSLGQKAVKLADFMRQETQGAADAQNHFAYGTHTK